MSKIFAELLTTQIISNVDPYLAEKLSLEPKHKSLGLFTTTIDDIGNTAADEATKKADVEVVYSKSFYAGSAHASGPLSGEFIGIIAGATPDEVKSGLDVIRLTIENKAYFEAINGDTNHALYANAIASCGKHLAKLAGIQEGKSLAYLIAPPVEAIVGMDAALKASEIQICDFYAPPSETNFGGGLLTGSYSSCIAATEAFREAIFRIAKHPLDY
ncbi:MAG TPA: ethanolamine utilization microcompartment protein EutL [Rummeliibacillus sp.]|nr:ethanolamine utilization microcompartment protein EutL [Rummeliibacillus sp.]